MSEQIIAVDLGGTQIRAARYDSELNILQRESTLTQAAQGPQATVKRMKAYIDKVMPADRAEVQGIGISSPGPLNPKTGVVIAPPNLPGWDNVPLGDMIADTFELPVYVANDANVAALAEASKGAAQGCRHVVYITVSTGIGSGIISDGRLVSGQAGLAAELGHIPVIVETNKVSSIELEAAGPAIARRAQAALSEGAASMLPELVAGDLKRIDARTVGKAAAAGDALSIATLAHAGRVIGLAIVTTVLLFNPEIVVVGGGVTKTGDLLFAPMRQAVADHILDGAFVKDLRIERAALGDDVALVGAAALVATAGGNLDISELDKRF
ncbi:MAG: ROK family protein [Chloroflexi bacterium]|nr:ROK family protein [Chloroflexota bacterium]